MLHLFIHIYVSQKLYKPFQYGKSFLFQAWKDGKNACHFQTWMRRGKYVSKQSQMLENKP